MASVGERLHRERLRRGLQLAQISRELKISARMLEAIEEEKFERLPAGVFAKSFVRQYARLLGLDEEELVAEVQRLNDSPFAIETLLDAEPAASHGPLIRVPRVEAWDGLGEKRFSWFSWIPAAALVILVMLICSAIYSRWQRNHDVASATRSMQPGAEAVRAKPSPAVPDQPPDSVPKSVPGTDVRGQPIAPSAGRPPGASADAESANRSNPHAAVRVELTAKEKTYARGSVAP